METEPDFVALAALDFSLKRALAKYPKGATMRVVARALCLSEDEARRLHAEALESLRRAMD